MGMKPRKKQQRSVWLISLPWGVRVFETEPVKLGGEWVSSKRGRICEGILKPDSLDKPIPADTPIRVRLRVEVLDDSSSGRSPPPGS